MIYTIQSAALTASVSDLGAELISVRYGGRERLWQNPDGSWAGHAPVLFPFCGRCAMVLNGDDYGIGFHGFASKQIFHVQSCSETSITLALEDTPQTLAQYPYRFCFCVTYTIVEDTLEIRYGVDNRNDQPMYFACGAHESFALPMPVTHYALKFEKPEQLVYQLHDAQGLLNGKTEDHGFGDTLPLENRDAAIGDTVILENLRSRRVRLVCIDNGECISETTFPDFSNLLLWHVKDSDYICIEPWQALPDKAGLPSEFTKKSGVQCLQPHQNVEYIRTIRYFEPTVLSRRTL